MLIEDWRIFLKELRKRGLAFVESRELCASLDIEPEVDCVEMPPDEIERGAQERQKAKQLCDPTSSARGRNAIVCWWSPHLRIRKSKLGQRASLSATVKLFICLGSKDDVFLDWSSPGNELKGVYHSTGVQCPVSSCGGHKGWLAS